MGWKIGEIVKKTGLTARALHFYEEQGLIGPISRTNAGHRFYTQTDLIRLQQIRSLRLLGIQISDMSDLLHDDTNKLKHQLKKQLERLKLQRKAVERFEDRTSKLLKSLESKETSSECLDNNLLQNLESMIMYNKYFTQNDINEIHNLKHNENDGLNTEEAWQQWIDSVKSLIQSKASPQSKEAKNLMAHWQEMLNQLTGGDNKRYQALNDLLHNEPQARRDHGIDDEIFEFMGKAMGGH